MPKEVEDAIQLRATAYEVDILRAELRERLEP